MESLDYLKKLISIKSYEKNNKEIIEYLIGEFSKYAKEIITVENDTDGKLNLIIGLNTNLKDVGEAIILSGHIDTVAPDEKLYNTNPLEGVVIDDKIFGLGSIDMKSFFASILANVNELKNMNVPIIIAITSDEETTFWGVKRIVDKMRELNIKPKFTIVGEPTNSQICAQSNGCFLYKIEAIGKSCHSSKPNLGINANYILANLILLIEKLCYKYEQTTTTCNLIKGGEADNIITGKSEMYFDVRTLSSVNLDRILSKVNNKIKFLKKKYNGADIKITQELNILPLENKSPWLINELCEKLKLTNTNFSGGCEAGYYQMLGGNAVIFGVGDLNLAHKPNEYALIDELESYFCKLKSMINIIKDFS